MKKRILLFFIISSVCCLAAQELPSGLDKKNFSRYWHVESESPDYNLKFMEHEKICKALDCIVFFADPYCSGQKGGVENINKNFREYFPKGTDFRKVNQEDLDKVQYQINKRPRKKGFSTPKKEFFKRIA